jgi:hypothetical protein
MFRFKLLILQMTSFLINHHDNDGLLKNIETLIWNNTVIVKAYKIGIRKIWK